MRNRFSLKKYIFSAVAGALFLAGAGLTQTASAETEYKSLRVMSYNVRHCSGLDDVVNIQRTGMVIRAQKPDVVAVQELDSCTTRSSKVYQLKTLASYSRMSNYYFAKAIPYGGGAYGVGIMSKEPAKSIRKVPLPGTEARVLLMVEFEDYVFACTHFDLTDSMRMNSVPIVREQMKRWNKPFIIAGDWNDYPNSKFLTALKQDLVTYNTAYTFPADKPTGCIDYIASYKPFPVVCDGSFVPENASESDHRPLVADLRIALTTGIVTPENIESKFVVKGRRLSFVGLTEQDKVSVHTLAGFAALPTSAPQDVVLTPGTYVVNVNGESCKVNVR